jgi:hypothetical protein
MKNIFLIIILFSGFGFAQEEVTHDYYWGYPEIGDYAAIVGAKNCYVREAPDVGSKLLDSLQLGHEVRVVKSSENHLVIKGLNLSWVAIEFKNSLGESKTGFLWKGFLALHFLKNNQNTFLTTIDKVEKKTESENYQIDYFSITTKVLDTNNKIIDQKTIQKSIADSYYFDNKLLGNMGLRGLQDIYRISFNGEACGIPSLFYYFGYSGQKFLELPSKYQVGDAGAFYHSENFIFPSEVGGKPDFILKNIEEAVNDDETGEKNTFVFDVTKHTEIYKWNGQKAVFVSKTKTKKLKIKDP